MHLTLENKVIGRTFSFDLSDDFMANPEDVRLLAGTECYKLVSTKSSKDKQRETLSIEFANKHFPIIYQRKLREETEIKDYLNTVFDSDESKELLEVADRAMLLVTMVISYRRYETVMDKLEALHKKIDNGKLSENVFFDYLKRTLELVKNSDCLKTFHDGIFELKEMNQCDERVGVGINTIFECVIPMLEAEQQLINEVKEANKGKDLKSLPIFTDKDFWIARFDEPKRQSITKLEELEQYWQGFQIGLLQNPDTKDKFEYMLSEFIRITEPLVKATMEMRNAVKKDDDPVAIEHARETVQNELKQYHKEMRHLEIVESVDCRKYKDVDEAAFVDSRFAEYRTVEQTASECTKGETYSWQDYLIRLSLNYSLYGAIQSKQVVLSQLMSGKYTDAELRRILEAPLIVHNHPDYHSEVNLNNILH